MERPTSRETVRELTARVRSLSPPYPTEFIDRLDADPRPGVQRLHELVCRRETAYRAELDRLDEMLVYERHAVADGAKTVAGVDEAGRGPLAGPVVAAAVILPAQPEVVAGLNDSKLLSAKRRNRLFEMIASSGAEIAWGIVSHRVIDRIGIQRANFMAMRLAVRGLDTVPDCLLVDGYPLEGETARCVPVVKGDRKSLSIAAASVVAKVTRDAVMTVIDGTYPQYGFAQHKGYATAAHYDAVRRYGFCPVHRRSFFENERQRLLPFAEAPRERSEMAVT